MEKKDFDEEEFIDEEEIVDEDEELDDDEFVDDEEIEEDEEDITPKKKDSKKAPKKKMKKGAKVAIITSSVVVAIVAIALVAIIVVLPLFGINLLAKSKSGELVDSIDFSAKLTGYSKNPNSVESKTKILNALTYDEAYMATLYASANSTNTNLVAAQMMYAATKNIATAYQYSYFKNQIGTTNIGSNQGTLIVQRMRRQNQTIKDDTTLKLPYNHNFGSLEAAFVTGEGKDAIRYVKDNKIYRIVSKTIDYDEKTGFLTCDDWKRSSKNYGGDDKPQNSANLTEARFNYISLVKDMKYIEDYGKEQDIADISQPKAVFKNDTAKIQDKGEYYEISVSVDSDVIDADAESAYMFEKDNSATGVHIEKCEIIYQIWKCGLPKAYQVDETWSGTIKVYAGSANAKSECKYSYTDDDCNDDSKTNAIWKSL